MNILPILVKNLYDKEFNTYYEEFFFIRSNWTQDELKEAFEISKLDFESNYFRSLNFQALKHLFPVLFKEVDFNNKNIILALCKLINLNFPDFDFGIDVENNISTILINPVITFNLAEDNYFKLETKQSVYVRFLYFLRKILF